MKYIKMLLIICLVELPFIANVDGAKKPNNQNQTTQQQEEGQPKVSCTGWFC